MSMGAQFMNGVWMFFFFRFSCGQFAYVGTMFEFAYSTMCYGM